MSANAIPATDPATPTVSPVLGYEPSAFGGPPTLPPITVLQRRRLRPAAPPRGAAVPDNTAAAAFADAALRRVLEVIDRRRPLAQLRPLLAAGLVESLLAAPAPRAGGSPARLRRVLAQPCRPDGRAAEVAANYIRGNRVHAIACRIEQLPTPTGPRWQVVALHMG